MKVYVVSFGDEYVFEADKWDIKDGILIIGDLENGKYLGCFKEWTYTGTESKSLHEESK
jgi:hypothetical protein